MRAARATRAGLAWLVVAGLSCNQIAGISEGHLRDCGALKDCDAKAPECQIATACNEDVCVFEDAMDGTTLARQTPGDCIEVVCDGKGRTRLVQASTDTQDDGYPCTLDACEGTTPTHTTHAIVPCYTGPRATAGIGDCKAGAQRCDEQHNPIGGCEGEVLPATEACTSAGDEDCDGQANEEGDGCVCGDGAVSIGTGETCDDGGRSDGDRCSPTCKAQEVLEVQAGWHHSCARITGGAVKCWGDNLDGELGLGDERRRGDEPDEMGDSLPTVDLGSGKTAVAIGVGVLHNCALLNDASVKCWGANSGGELGMGNFEGRGADPDDMGDNLPTVDLGSGKTAVAISVGFLHTCALLNDSSVKCWGRNEVGALGLGDTEARGDNPGEMGDNLPAVDFGAGKNAVAISAGSSYTCALLNDASVKCWGYNFAGELGLGDAEDRGDNPGEMGDNLPAVDFGAGKNAVAISAANTHTCALLNDASVKCWGYNIVGELGLGDTQSRGDEPGEMGDNLPAVRLGTGTYAVAISAGTGHTCALLDDTSVRCWGDNIAGELGLGNTDVRGDEPGDMGNNLPAVRLGTGKYAVAISAGTLQTCALLNDASVKCWGDNPVGQLGLGDVAARGDEPNEMGNHLLSVKLFSPFW